MKGFDSGFFLSKEKKLFSGLQVTTTTAER
jgi:hypothetical protein